ncbi:MAG: hypothetical protein IPJ65_28720 [Archangiaceae bacterium]|nr:hypothetical protein [Archangiaceae bacterium]
MKQLIVVATATLGAVLTVSCSNTPCTPGVQGCPVARGPRLGIGVNVPNVGVRVASETAQVDCSGHAATGCFVGVYNDSQEPEFRFTLSGPPGVVVELWEVAEADGPRSLVARPGELTGVTFPMGAAGPELVLRAPIKRAGDQQLISNLVIRPRLRGLAADAFPVRITAGGANAIVGLGSSAPACIAGVDGGVSCLAGVQLDAGSNGFRSVPTRRGHGCETAAVFQQGNAAQAQVSPNVPDAGLV